MSPARRALQQLQFDLNGTRGTTPGHLPLLRCATAGQPYVVQFASACWWEHPHLPDTRKESFEFGVQGVALLRAELIGLGLLGPRPAAVRGPSVWELIRRPWPRDDEPVVGAPASPSQTTTGAWGWAAHHASGAPEWAVDPDLDVRLH